MFPKKTWIANRHVKDVQHHNHQGNTIKTSVISPHTCRDGYYQKDKAQVFVKMWIKGNQCLLLVQM